MSKWFGITIVVLLVFWLSVLSLAQRRLIVATRTYSLTIMQHEADLTGIKLRIARPTALAKPTPQFASPAPFLPRQRRGPGTVVLNFESPDIEPPPVSRCW